MFYRVSKDLFNTSTVKPGTPPQLKQKYNPSSSSSSPPFPSPSFPPGSSSKRRLGVSVIVNLLQDNLDKVTESLWKLFQFAEEYSLAVVVALDGFEWWGKQSDLWNFWDPNMPG